MAGKTLAEVGFTQEIIPPFFSVKEAVFPFAKFPGVDPILGPEMKSTGEVMGVGDSFAEAFAKAQLGPVKSSRPPVAPSSASAKTTSRSPPRWLATWSRWASKW